MLSDCENSQEKLTIVKTIEFIRIGLYVAKIEIAEQNGLFDVIIRIPLIYQDSAENLAKKIAKRAEEFEKIEL